MNLGTNKPLAHSMLSDATQVRTIVMIADELDVCPIVLFKFILLPRDNKSLFGYSNNTCLIEIE